MKSNRLILAIAISLAISTGLLKAETPPNFVIFLTDDMGYGDAACYGHAKIKTPNLDAFARQGVRLTNCYSADSVCSPSRSAILTGRTPFRNGVWRWIPPAWNPGVDHSEPPRNGSEVHLRSSEITIATLLQKRGHETCHSGKWHLNGFFNRPEQPQPNDHGYDWWFAAQNNAYPTHKNPENFVRNGKAVGPLEGFSAPLVAAEANDWIANRRDKSKPFFITVWTHEPHLPIESDPEFMEVYKEIDNPGIRQHHGNITQLPVYGCDLFPTVCDLVGIPLPDDRVIDGASIVPMFEGKPIVFQDLATI